jgi:short-subunit dehydrogenase
MNIKDKTIVITGATGGIGSVLSQKLKDLGANVLTVGRDQSKEATYHADLTDPISRQELVNQIIQDRSKIDILIHSAGIGIYKPLSEITQSDWDLSFSLNVEAPFFLTQALSTILEKSTDSLVLTIGSGAGTIPMRGRSLYCATKFALRGLMLSLAEESRGTHPAYCLITLGSTLTPFGPLSLEKKIEESLNGKAYFTPVWVADKLIGIMQNDDREDEITLFPGDYGFGEWKKP